MRSFACLGLLLAVALASGCDSDQPLALADRNVTLDFSAPDAVVDRYDVWDLTEQGNSGEWLWCERVAAPNQNATASSVPWTYSLQVSILPAGGVDFVPITSPAALQDGTNRAGYDTNVTASPINRPAEFDVFHDRGECTGDTDLLCNPNSTAFFCEDNDAGSCVPVYSCTGDDDTICDPGNLGDTCSSEGAGVCTPAGTCSGDPGIVCEPTCGELGLGVCEVGTVQRRFEFNGITKRRITSASEDFVRPKGNLLNDTCAGNSCTGLPPNVVLPGLCPATSVEAPLIDQDEPPYTFALAKGETMMVEARRFDSQPTGIQFLQTPRIRASMLLDGIELQPDDICPEDDEQCNITDANSISEIKFFFVSK